VGALVSARWEAFRSELASTGRLSGAWSTDEGTLDHLLVYAVALGFSHQVLAAAAPMTAGQRFEHNPFFWYSLGRQDISTGLDDLVTDIGQSFTSSSSSSGTGGSFSSGGGGGSSGGSSGGGGGGAW
jgi:uncharacterized membrane protein